MCEGQRYDKITNNTGIQSLMSKFTSGKIPKPQIYQGRPLDKRQNLCVVVQYTRCQHYVSSGSFTTIPFKMKISDTKVISSSLAETQALLKSQVNLKINLGALFHFQF